MNAVLQKAARYLIEGNLEACHALVQENEGLDGNYLHAILHRKEGDLSNCLYWYHRAPDHPINAALEKVFPGWTPDRFVQSLRDANDPTHTALVEAAELAAIAQHFQI